MPGASPADWATLTGVIGPLLARHTVGIAPLGASRKLPDGRQG